MMRMMGVRCLGVPASMRRAIPVRTPCHSDAPCHSERSEESPPFAERKGARGMPHVIPAEAGASAGGTPIQRGGMPLVNHDCHDVEMMRMMGVRCLGVPASMRRVIPTHPVIPSAARNLPPSRSARGLGGCPTSFRRKPALQRAERPSRSAGLVNHDCHDVEMMRMMGVRCLGVPASMRRAIPVRTPCHSDAPCRSERSEESPPFAERKGVRGMPHVIPAQAGIQRVRDAAFEP